MSLYRMPDGEEYEFENDEIATQAYKAWMNQFGDTNPPTQTEPTIMDKIGSYGRQIVKPYKDLANIAVEVPTTLATGMISSLAGNIAGMGSDLYSGVTRQPRVGEEVKDEIVKDFTYQPRSQISQEFLGMLGETLRESKLEGLPIAGQELPLLGKAIKQGVPAATELATTKITAPSEAMLKFAKQNQPKISAAEDAKRLGLVVDPSEVNPTKINRLAGAWAGHDTIDKKAAMVNLPKIKAILQREANIDGDDLSSDAFKAAREKLSKPYEDVKNLGNLKPNPNLANSLRSSIPQPIVGKESKINDAVKSIETVAARIEDGSITASEAVNSIRGYREDAKNWYKIAARGDSERNPTEMAKAYQTIADTLEDAIDSTIPQNSQLLNDFRKARKDLAKNYTVEKIIDTETQLPDLSVLNTPRFKDLPLSDDLAKLRTIQSNFPYATSTIDKYGASLPKSINRSSFGGTAGAAASMAAGSSPSSGGILGSVTSLLGGRYIANKMISPEWQANHLIPNVPRPKQSGLEAIRIIPLNQSFGQDQLPHVANAPLLVPGSWRRPLSEQSSNTPLPVLPDDVLPMSERYPPSIPIGVVEAGGTVSSRTPLPNLPPLDKGLLSLVNDVQQPVPDTKRLATRHDVPTIEFPLRQEVLQEPAIKNSIEQFIGESERLKQLVSNSQGFWKERYTKELQNLQQEFGEGMRQLGIDNPQEAVGALRKLYDSGKDTKLTVQQTGKGGLESMSWGNVRKSE